MQSVSSRIWTRITVSTSYNDNHYITGTSVCVCVSKNTKIMFSLSSLLWVSCRVRNYQTEKDDSIWRVSLSHKKIWVTILWGHNFVIFSFRPLLVLLHWAHFVQYSWLLFLLLEIYIYIYIYIYMCVCVCVCVCLIIVIRALGSFEETFKCIVLEI